ncbi:MAG: J domain-containing protein [Myxococcales bacterium]|nr:J domain-containing protein [Myxococcales bacterium]
MSQRKDLYSVLGVPRNVDDDTLRTTYRKLARDLHPDVNPGDDSAEERFKEVTEAYAVLSDPEKRRNYDEFGDVSLQAGFDAEAARRAQAAFGGGRGHGGEPFGFGGGEGGGAFGFGGAQGFDLDDLFAQFGAGGRGPRQGGDLEAEIELDFFEAVRGAEKRLTLNRPRPGAGLRAEAVTVRIPPGVAEGGRIRLRGKGQEGSRGGPPGDLWATVRVRPHPFFRREGRDLHVEVPVTVTEATLGAQIEVPTLEGRATVTLPPGTDSGRRLRLVGKGVPAPRAGSPGNLYITIQIVVPKSLDAAQKEALATLEKAEPANPRAELFS